MNKSSLEGTLVRITPSEKGFAIILFRLENGGYGRTYTGPQYRNYAMWSELNIGDFVVGLRWKDSTKNLIDADSPVHLLQDSFL